MSAASAAVERRFDVVDPIEAFEARCEARALLYRDGEFDLAEAIDKLQADAERDGFVARLGQDAVQAIMADAFLSARRGEWESAAISTVGPAKAPVVPVARDGCETFAPFPPSLVDLPETSREAASAHNRTPGSTVEALMWSLRESGLGCLSDESNRDRLRRCDADAIKEICARLLDLKSRSKGRLYDWTKENVAKLVSAWAVRGRF
jgi:hypothetical protein